MAPVSGYTGWCRVLATDVAPIAELAGNLPYDLAHAVSTAHRQDALLATYERAKYADAVNADDILDLRGAGMAC